MSTFVFHPTRKEAVTTAFPASYINTNRKEVVTIFELYYINQSGQCFDIRDFPESEYGLDTMVKYAREAVRYRCAARIIIKHNGKTVSKVR